MLPTQKQLQDIVEKLKPILKIQDWKISIELCGDKKMQEFDRGI
jgi:ssRNA-specific RNase YbeY (16S rRNA maturation enzyme)